LPAAATPSIALIRRNSCQAGGDADDLASSSPFPSPSSTGTATGNGNVNGSVNGINKTASTRALWQGRDQKGTQDHSTSVARRSSLEKLKRASRVQNNSKLFNKSDAKAVRPTSYPQVPPAFTPIFSRTGSVRTSIASTSSNASSNTTERGGGSRIPLPKSKKSESIQRASTPPTNPPLTGILHSPIRLSPTKSSLLSSHKSNSYDSEEGDPNRSPVRRPKSVSWDKDEPHVLEYELVTPDPSVDGSPCADYDSDEYGYEDEDDLENTPVIEPNGWRITPEPIHDREEAYSTPSPNGSSRPLPPIPGLPRSDSSSPSGARPLPNPPLTKAELQNQSTMTMEERMRRMMEGNDPTRRLSWDPTNRRRSRHGTEFHNGLGIGVDTIPTDTLLQEHENVARMTECTTSDRDESSPNSNREPDSESIVTTSQYESSASASDYEPPQLTRESIRRQVEERRHQHAQDEEHARGGRESPRYYYSSSESRHDDEESFVKDEPTTDEEGDMYAMPDMRNVRPASRFATRSPDTDVVTESEASLYEDDDEQSQYSVQEVVVVEEEEEEEEQPDTPRQGNTPVPGSPASLATESTQSSLALENKMMDLHLDDEENKRVSLPDFSSILDDGLGLGKYMTPSPPATAAAKEEGVVEGPSTATAREFLDEEMSDRVPSDEESDTGSVIRHKIEYSDDEDYEEEYDEEDGEVPTTRSPSPVAESIATIRAPGGKLKTRASATPADIAAMAAARRHVSGDQRNPPPVPRIPNGYRSEGDSETGESSGGEESTGGAGGQSDGETVSRRVSGARRRKISATLPALGEFEFDLKLDDLNDEFDRVIEKQKVENVEFYVI